MLEIEGLSFEYRWTEEDFLSCLRQRSIIGMVAEDGEYVRAFMIYELEKSHLRVLNFAVHPDYRRRKIGHQLVAKLVSKLSSHRRTKIVLDVRESNLDAQLFFKNEGFEAVKILRGHYEDSGEDAFRMAYRFCETEESPANRLVQFTEDV